MSIDGNCWKLTVKLQTIFQFSMTPHDGSCYAAHLQQYSEHDKAGTWVAALISCCLNGKLSSTPSS